MNFTPNDDTEKLLRSMWFGFTDNSFDKKGKQWSFTGSPYISKVGGNGADSVVFDGSTTISANLSGGLDFTNLQVNFGLQLATINACTIFSAGDFYLKLLSSGKLQMSYFNSNNASSPETSSTVLAVNTRYNISVRFFRYTDTSSANAIYYYTKAETYINNSRSIYHDATLYQGGGKRIPTGTNFASFKIGEGLKGFISNFSVVTNGNTISQF